MRHGSAAVNSSGERVKGKISTSVLAKMWQSAYGLNVNRFFPSPEMELQLVPPYNYYRFTSARSGDAEFYALLMRRMGYEPAEREEFSEAALEIATGEKILDVGSGTGNFSTRCRGEYKGIETNPAAVVDAAKLGRNVHFGLVEDEEPDSYDVVVAFQVLEHVDDPKSFIKACVKCLRPGGRLVLSTPDMDGVVGYVANEILNYPPHHMTWWTESSLRTLIADCECEPVRVWYEPLRKVHIYHALSALYWPRGEGHLVPSIRFRIMNLGVSILARIAASKWDHVPFVKGHTVMVVATKVPRRETA
jgi:SAM-dependent methyltransferase